MISTRKALGLVVLSAAFGFLGAAPVHAQMGSDRQQFLELILRYENRVIATNLRPPAAWPDGRLGAAVKAYSLDEMQLGRDLKRLDREVPGNPPLARDLRQLERQWQLQSRQAPGNLARVQQLGRLEDQLEHQERVLEQRIANTAGTPLHGRLVQEERALRRELQVLGRELAQLRHEVPNSPQRARQIAQLERLLAQKIRLDAQHAQQINRVLATPFTPIASINVFAL